MFKRDFTLVTIHGDTDRAAREAWWEANEDGLDAIAAAAGETRERKPLVCDVQVVFRDEDGGRLELHFSAWDDVATLAVGQTATITVVSVEG